MLDQRALDALAGSDGPAKRRVRQAMVAASRLRRDVVVPTVVLAELYRGGGRNQLIDALLSREELALVLRDTDRVLARLVGGVLSAAGAGSEDLADAHVVAVAVEGGGGVVLTGDPNDMARLSDPYRTVAVEGLPSR
ncbi:MAG: PIN domain-containing protein [Ilumatobacteraceae bacterium]